MGQPCARIFLVAFGNGPIYRLQLLHNEMKWFPERIGTSL